MEQLIAFINQYTHIGNEVEKALYSKVKFESYRKNQFVLEQGEKANKVWFIKSGLVRRYFLSDGKENTIWIHTENEMITSMQGYFEQKPSKEYIQAIEETKLISISRENSLELNKYPEMVEFSMKLITSQFARLDEILKKFSLMTAVEKYNFLLEKTPYIIKRAKLGYIASIMGVSQETLSRIRAKN